MGVIDTILETAIGGMADDELVSAIQIERAEADAYGHALPWWKALEDEARNRGLSVE